MKARLSLILPIFIALAIIPNLAHAIGCGAYPSGTQYCASVNVINTQTSAITANTHIFVNLNAGLYNSIVIANTLKNIELYNSITGSVLPANSFWIIGNTLNPQQSNSLQTSNNIGIWIVFPEQIAASSTDNNIFIAFMANTVNNLGTLGGVAPQLWCTAGNCPQTSYGQYDTGSKVFNVLYQGFPGSSTPSGWTNNGFIINNGIQASLNTTPNSIVSTTLYGLSSAQVLDYLWTSNSAVGNVNNGDTGYVTTNDLYAIGWRLNGNPTNNANFIIRTNAAPVRGIGSSASAWHETSVWWFGTANAITQLDYGTPNTVTQTTYSVQAPIGAVQSAGSSPIAFRIQYFIIRNAPPNNIQPTVTIETLTSTSTKTTLIATPNPYTLTNTVININQVSIANTIISNGYAGTTSYTGNWLWVAPNTVTLSNTTIAALPATNNALTLTINAVSSNSLKMTFNGINYYANAIGTNTIYGTWTFNAFAGDANGDSSPSPALTNTITISQALSTPTLTPTPSLPATIDIGQSLTLAASWSGGTSTYSANYIITNTVTGTVLTYQLYTGISGTSNTFTWTPSSSYAGNTIKANVIITDSKPSSANSVYTGTLTINTAQVAGTLTESNTIIDVGQSSTLTGNPSGGTTPYTISYFSQASCGGTSIGSGATLSVSPTVPTTYSYNSVDSATTKNVVCSASNSITVNAALGIPSIAPSAANKYDAGQTIVFSTTVTGGTANYQYQWKVYNSVTGTTLNTTTYTNVASTSNTFTFTANSQLAGNTINANVLVTDSATTPVSTNSVKSGTLTINTALSANAITPPNPTIDNGQTITLTSHASGGTAPYSYHWFESTVGDPHCNNANVISGTSSTKSITPTATSYYTYNVIDSATTPVVACSASDMVTVNPSLVANAPTASLSSVVYWGSTTLTAQPSGGTTPYTAYQWYSGSSATCSSDTPISGATSSTYTQTNFPSKTYYCYTVTDSAYSPSNVMSSTTLVSLLGYQFISNSYSATAYETSSQSFAWTFNVAGNGAVTNVILQVNGVNSMLQSFTSPSMQAHQFSFSYPISLLPANNVAWTFNALLNVTFPNSTLKSYGVVNTVSQQEYQNYFPAVALIHPNIIQGEAQTMYMNITQASALNAAAVPIANWSIGNKQGAMATILAWKYYQQFPSFVSNNFSLTAPAFNSPTTVQANAIVQLSFNSNSLYRNVSHTFNLYYPTLLTCSGATYPTAFNFTYWNVPNMTRYTSNVLMQGSYLIKNGLYTSNTINGTDAGLVLTATNNTYKTCISPTWAQFNTFSNFVYNGTSPATETLAYYFNNQSADNQTQNVHLYLIPTISAPSQYEIGVENVTTQQYLAALVEVEQYIPNTNSSIVIDEFKTQAGSGYIINLETNKVYKFTVYSLSGQYLTQTGYLQAACALGNTCLYIITIGQTIAPTLSNYIENINYGCTTILNNITEIGTESCTFRSVNGSTAAMFLTIFNKTPINNIPVCFNNLTSLSGTLTCTGNHINETSYTWQLIYRSYYGNVTLTQGAFGVKTSYFGSIGWLITLMLLIGIGCLFIFINPIVSTILSAAVFILAGVADLIVLTPVTVGGIVIMVAMVIFGLNRNTQGG